MSSLKSSTNNLFWVLTASLVTAGLIGLGTYLFMNGDWRVLRDLQHYYLPCKGPITYSIGQVDESFQMSETEFAISIETAISLWETQAGSDLFKLSSNEHPDLTINLIYDFRQAGTETLNDLNADLTTQNETYSDLQQKYDDIFAIYENQKTQLDVQLKNHEIKNQAYKDRVTTSNAQGGAGPKAFEELEDERKKLNDEAAAINNLVLAINDTADQVNNLADQLNNLADDLNLTTNRYNKVGQTLGDEFVEGSFGASSQGHKIDIYQFEDRDRLIRVLAHELGHALGLGHVEDPQAVMFYLNEADGYQLTTADTAALQELCKLN